MSDPVQYLAALCAAQGVPFRVEDNGRTLWVGGTVTLPKGAGLSFADARQPKPTSIVLAVRSTFAFRWSKNSALGIA